MLDANRDLTVLTPGERLWVWRHQHALTGPAAARRLRVGRNRYWDAEGDGRPLETMPAGSKPDISLTLKLARRRSKLGLLEVSRRLGVSRVTLLEYERTGAATLVGWWEKRGYSFG